jgi:hypothetical protein
VTDLAVAMKRCTKCGEVKNLSEFYQTPRVADGHSSSCKTCQREAKKQHSAQRRAEMGDDAWLALQAARTAKSRKKPHVREKGNEVNKRRWLALAALRDRHRAEYEHLLLLAKRGEL